MPDQGWDGLREELAADVRRVADRLRSMSAARLAGQPAPPDPESPGLPYRTRAEAARLVATALAATAEELEAAAAGLGAPGGPGPLMGARAMPVLGDFAAADQLQVTGNDLLAALDLVAPDAEVTFGNGVRSSARDRVTEAAALLADLRRRL